MLFRFHQFPHLCTTTTSSSPRTWPPSLQHLHTGPSCCRSRLSWFRIDSRETTAALAMGTNGRWPGSPEQNAKQERAHPSTLEATTKTSFSPCASPDLSGAQKMAQPQHQVPDWPELRPLSLDTPRVDLHLRAHHLYRERSACGTSRITTVVVVAAAAIVVTAEGRAGASASGYWGSLLGTSIAPLRPTTQWFRHLEPARSFCSSAGGCCVFACFKVHRIRNNLGLALGTRAVVTVDIERWRPQSG